MLRLVDEIEVFLGYQVKLREPLCLTGIIEEMRFFSVSWITPEDLNNAERQVKTAENRQFTQWLAVWEPWHNLVERTEPELWQAVKKEREQTYENDYQKRLNALLKKENMQNKDDALRTAGREIHQKMDREIFEAMTVKALVEKNHHVLLNKPWDI